MHEYRIFLSIGFPALWPFGNFDPIQYATFQCNSSDMVCWMHVKVGRLLDPHMQMCIKLGCFGLVHFVLQSYSLLDFKQFDPIQYASCTRNASDMVCWIHMKVDRLLDSHVHGGRMFRSIEFCQSYGRLDFEILTLSSMHIATPLIWFVGHT